MQPHNMVNRFAGFSSGTQRSDLDWIERLGETKVAELVSIGALKLSVGKGLDEFVGRFDFGSGAQEYMLRYDGARIIADPVGGGDTVVYPAVKVYEAMPKKLAEVIAAANEFGLTESPGPGGESIYLLERTVESKEKIVVRVALLLDDDWISLVGAEEWACRLAKGARIFAFLRDGGGRIPWDSDKVTSVNPLPESNANWLIDSRLYCDQRAGLPAEVLAQICKDRKFVYDGVNKKIFVYGEELDLLSSNLRFKYLLGSLRLGSSPIAEDKFALDHLGLHVYSEGTVRKARNGCKSAISKALAKKPHLIDEVHAMLVPEPPRKMVMSRVNEHDVLWLPYQE